ncbi:MAG: sugar phosphate isomerase/epimerase [Clostridia bacterium]|nr:sugar phosphate isomerase/epimerase [Clostridia bacterium]
MRLATTTGDFGRFCEEHLDRIKHVHAAGFRCMDLSLYTVREGDELLVLEDWRKTASRIKDYADRNGIEFVQSHGPGLNPLESDASFENAVALTIRAIEVCGELGIPNMVVHPGWDSNATKEEWFVKNKQFFARLFPAMEKANVNVLHENTTSANMSCYYSKTGKEMREFSEYVNHPLFHSCWDTGHANIEGSQYDEILAIGDDLLAVHINDNRGAQDEHIIPFLGTLNMDEIMHALKDVGFKGCFTLEAGSTLRSKHYWLGNRHGFEKDTRLANPPLILQQHLEKFMYCVGEYILTTYGVFEK